MVIAVAAAPASDVRRPHGDKTHLIAPCPLTPSRKYTGALARTSLDTARDFIEADGARAAICRRCEHDVEPGMLEHPTARLDSARLDGLIEALARDGFAVAPALFDYGLVDRLQAAAELRESSGALARAAIGREAGRNLETRVRNVEACWLDSSDAADAEFLGLAEQVRVAINRRLFLGLFEFEAQLLVYPPGGYYKRHLDSFAGARNRIVSLVAYLNREWQEGDGGELDIWRTPSDEGAPAAKVAPRAGTIVLMLSEEIPHAVRPSLTVRRVIAGWFRVNASDSGRVDPAR